MIELEDVEKKVFEALKGVIDDSDGEMVSTNRVREESGIHYYRTEKALDVLANKGMVEKIETDTVTLWKVVDGV